MKISFIDQTLGLPLFTVLIAGIIILTQFILKIKVLYTILILIGFIILLYGWNHLTITIGGGLPI